MKHEWRKKEKAIYLPASKPEIIDIPEYKYFTINGAGNPNDDFFPEYISILYCLSYAIKMSPKKDLEPKGYFDYTVYPLEGIWDLKEEAKKNYDGKLNKDDLVFTLMIRQPDFVDQTFAKEIIELTKKNKPNDLLDQVNFKSITDGLCIQMMHLGSYDNESESFHLMEKFASGNNLIRTSKIHREIYLSDARKVASENLKTLLRFQVKK